MLTDTSGLGDIYIKDDDSYYVKMFIYLSIMLYIDYVYFDHEFMGSILPCCYTCGVRHELTLVISLTLQCVVRCYSEEGQGVVEFPED
jgi:hypothetical protein